MKQGQPTVVTIILDLFIKLWITGEKKEVEGKENSKLGSHLK
jgi:hypothetical protein